MMAGRRGGVAESETKPSVWLGEGGCTCMDRV
jgi:hypothetical protein